MINKKIIIPLPTLHAQLKPTIFYNFLFDIFYLSAAVAEIVIHLKSIDLYIFIFEIDFNIFFIIILFIYLLIFI